MERQAGLGRSLEDVLDSFTPGEPADSAPRHVLFGLGSDDAAASNGSTDPRTKMNKKTKKKKKKKGKKKKSKK